MVVVFQIEGSSKLSPVVEIYIKYYDLYNGWYKNLARSLVAPVANINNF